MKKRFPLLVSVLFSTALWASPASDNAGNYSSWANGDNQGSGFQAWQLSATDGGSFLGAASLQGSNNSPLDTSGQSFGLWATNFSTAYRNFDNPLQIGEVLDFSFAYQFDNGNKGFNLLSSDTQVFNFNLNNAGYTWTDGGSAVTTPWSGVRENGVLISFAITGTATGFDYSISSAQDANLNTSGSIISGAVDEVGFYVSGAGGGTGGDLYFNNLQIIPEPDIALLFLSGMGVIYLIRRRQN
ncbi:hypothetical protein P0Y35_01575 [Kiritimatiellaeota bacterium B1221]|nr:hypothetical protein [Kiritimatiellaeota bacterium B1221]